MTIDIQELLEEVKEILESFPYKPFLCLPLSARLYATLKDKYAVNAQLVTGNLSFKDTLIFKQDFQIENAESNRLQSWAGHAWVEVDDVICDLSFFRTLYSTEFRKNCKQELLDHFGEGRGASIGTYENLVLEGLLYKRLDVLKDETATGILRGVPDLPIWD